MQKNDEQHRMWRFTWNNYPEDITVEDFSKLKYSYLFYGKEICPTTGTPHLQGYAEFKSGKRFSTLKKFNDKISWRTCQASADANIKYCNKDGVTFESGTKSSQGKRTDIDNAMEAVKEGMSELELFENHSNVAFRYPGALNRYRLLVEKKNRPKYLKKYVEVRHGTTGSGKTSSVMEEYPDAFIVSEGVTGLWWDGYDGEDVVLLDEFRGNIPLSHLLRILDGYACQVSIKGGSKYLNATKIFITSNVDPSLWYKNADQASVEALMRRITVSRFMI